MAPIVKDIKSNYGEKLKEIGYPRKEEVSLLDEVKAYLSKKSSVQNDIL